MFRSCWQLRENMKNQTTFLLTIALLGLSACASPAPAPNAPNAKTPTAGNKPTTGALGANDVALLAAANKGDNAKVTELLGQGANVNAQNEAGSTPLIEAVYNNHADTVKLLLEKGADPNARKNDGAAAIGFAKKYPAILEMLKAAGARE